MLNAIFSLGTSIIGLARKEIFINEVTTFPPFIRFNDVQLEYRYFGLKAIEQKCDSIESKLLQFEHVLIDSDLITFNAEIRQNNHSQFNNHSELLVYIRTRLLPICDYSRGYKFDINFKSDENSVPIVIESLLQMRTIMRCSKVQIVILCVGKFQLPVEEISNWLEQLDGMENKVQSKKAKLLEIGFFDFHTIQNTQEIIDRLQMVYFNTFFKLRLILNL